MRRELAKQSGITFAGSIVGAALRFISEAVAARMLSAAEFGLFGLAISSIAIAQVGATGGIRAAVQRFGAVYVSRHQAGKVTRLIWRSLGLVLVVSTVIAGVIAFIPNEIAQLMGSDSATKLLPLVALGVPVVAIAYLFTEVLRAHHLVVRFVMLRDVVAAAGMLIALFIIASCVARTDSIHVLSAYVIGFLLASILGGVWVVAAIYYPPLSTGRIDNEGSRTPVGSAKWFLFWSTLLNIVLIFRERSMLFIVSHELGADAVAQYFVAARFLLVAGLIRAAMNSFLSPKIAALSASGRWVELERHYQMVARWSVLAVIPAAVFLGYASEYLSAQIFGERYSDIGDIVAVMLAFQALSVGLGPSSIALQMTGKPKVEIVFQLLGITGVFLAGWLVIPRYGLTGAAAAAYGAVLLIDVIRMVYVKRKVGLVPLSVQNAGGLLAIVGVWLISYLVWSLWDDSAIQIAGVAACLVLTALIGWNTLVDVSERMWIRKRIRAG